MDKRIDNHVEPIRITDKENDTVYTLDFSRESVTFMARQGFKVNEDIVELAADKVPDFFYYSFRKNHMNVARNKTDALLKKMGGLSPKVIARLVELYNQALMSNSIIQTDEELEKNSNVTVEIPD